MPGSFRQLLGTLPAKVGRHFLGIERRRIRGHASGLSDDRLDALGCPLFLSQFYSLWDRSVAAGLPWISCPWVASTHFRRDHGLVCDLAPTALCAAKTIRFMERPLCTSRDESRSRTRSDTNL